MAAIPIFPYHFLENTPHPSPLPTIFFGYISGEDILITPGNQCHERALKRIEKEPRLMFRGCRKE
jgi:hypothetical protein